MKEPKRREKLCLQIQQSSVVCCPDPLNAQQLLLTAACLICCCTMSLCTSPNPCAECRRRVNYICISWCRLDNPFIHTPQSSASRCVYHDESTTQSSHSACMGGFCFVSDTVAILEGNTEKETNQDAAKPMENSLWCINLIKMKNWVTHSGGMNLYTCTQVLYTFVVLLLYLYPFHATLHFFST